MPEFDDSAVSVNPPEEVWKALYDPARFPEWWVSVEKVEGDAAGGGDFTVYPPGYPDFPIPQQLQVSEKDQRVTISCLVSFIGLEWRLAPHDGGGTEISVHVEIPEEEAHRLDDQRAGIRESITRLAAL
jgi:uncharacterized protein YndB with AHSA1/START domain